MSQPSRSLLGQTFGLDISGQNYIINANQTVLANSSSPFVFDLTGIAGRVRLTYAMASTNQIPPVSVRDLQITSIIVERFDATRPEDILIDGELPLHHLFSEQGAALPGLLAAVELLLARSRLRVQIQNTTNEDIFVSCTFAGFTTYEDEYQGNRGGGPSITERGAIPQASF